MNSQTAALLKHLSASGDKIAQALVEGNLDVSLSAAAEAANSITVTGQVVDGVGNRVAGVRNVLIKSVPIAGTGLLTDGGAGTVKAGSGTVEMWMQTDATGGFQVAVANIVAEQNLLQVTLSNGDVAQMVLTFA